MEQTQEVDYLKMSRNETRAEATADLKATIENPGEANGGKGTTVSSATPTTKQRQRPLWLLFFLALLPLLLLPVLGKVVWRLRGPVGKPGPEKVLPEGEQIPGKPKEKPELSPEEKEEALPPEAIAEEVYGPEAFLPPEPFSFKDNAKVLELLTWVANSKYVEGKTQDWRSLLKEAFESGADIPDIQGVIASQKDRKEVMTARMGKHIRLSCALVELQPGWNGLQVARELARKLLPLLEETLSPDYLASVPVRQHTMKLGTESTGIALATLSVGRMKNVIRFTTRARAHVFGSELKEGALHE